MEIDQEIRGMDAILYLEDILANCRAISRTIEQNLYDEQLASMISSFKAQSADKVKLSSLPRLHRKQASSLIKILRQEKPNLEKKIASKKESLVKEFTSRYDSCLKTESSFKDIEDLDSLAKTYLCLYEPGFLNKFFPNKIQRYSSIRSKLEPVYTQLRYLVKSSDQGYTQRDRLKSALSELQNATKTYNSIKRKDRLLNKAYGDISSNLIAKLKYNLHYFEEIKNTREAINQDITKLKRDIEAEDVESLRKLRYAYPDNEFLKKELSEYTSLYATGKNLVKEYDLKREKNLISLLEEPDPSLEYPIKSGYFLNLYLSKFSPDNLDLNMLGHIIMGEFQDDWMDRINKLNEEIESMKFCKNNPKTKEDKKYIKAVTECIKASLRNGHLRPITRNTSSLRKKVYQTILSLNEFAKYSSAA